MRVGFRLLLGLLFQGALNLGKELSSLGVVNPNGEVSSVSEERNFHRCQRPTCKLEPPSQESSTKCRGARLSLQPMVQ